MLCSGAVQRSMFIIFMITTEPVFNISIESSEILPSQEPLILVSPPVESDLKIVSRVLNSLTNNNELLLSGNKLVKFQKKIKRKRQEQQHDKQFNKFKSIDFSNIIAKHQFCGETLVYAVEYYCVYVKGSSLYTPDYYFENTYVNSDDETSDTEKEVDAKSRRNIKVNDSIGIFNVYSSFFILGR